MSNLKVCYVWDENLINETDRLPAVAGRASMVHSLIAAYKLPESMTVVRSAPATYKELKIFQTALYLDYLKRFIVVDEDYVTSTQDEEYGIGFDCEPLSNMSHLVATLAGGSITAAKCLVLGIANVAINWCGGWHHAQRSAAAGFCYVNDIVLAIEMLRRKFPKVLYVDLDVHHGNGVQDFYVESKSVITLSFHKFEPGFYPGTGGLEDIGNLDGKGYCYNFPFQDSYSDDTFVYIFEKVFTSIYTLFEPDAIVVQCGADALAHDPYGGARMTSQGYCDCLRYILDKRKPTLMLGGGGYKNTNAARLWTSLTALATGVTLEENIPEHEHWLSYGPDYTLTVEPSLAKPSHNIKEYLDDCFNTILGNVKKYLENEDVVKSHDEPELKRLRTESKSTNSVNKICYKQGEESIENKNIKVIGKQSELRKESKSDGLPNIKSVSDIYAFDEE